MLVVLALGLRVLAAGLPLLLGVFLKNRVQTVAASSLSREQALLPPLLGILAPLLVLGIFAVRGPRREERRLPDKVGLGMLLTVASFTILLLGALVGGDAGPASAPWLVLFNVTSSVGFWLVSSICIASPGT
jgi:dipeptide/tripeptide permease